MHEIACKHCGGPISLNEVWDRTPDGFRASDWKTHCCIMCGGVMTFYARWVDPPKTHSQCLDGRWHDEPCSMCFGPMALSDGIEPAPKFHSRCVPENWYERTCEACDQPLKIHIDWEDVPTVHRRCETQDWYEKQCKYCNAALKVHIDWETAPDAHDECKPATTADVPVGAPTITNPDTTSENVLVPFYEIEITPEIVEPIPTNGNGSTGLGLFAEPETEIATESEGTVTTEAEIDNEPALAIESDTETVDATPTVDAIDGELEIEGERAINGETEAEAEIEIDSEPAIAIELATETADAAPIVNAIEDELETAQGAEILIERNGSVERDVEIAETSWKIVEEAITRPTQPIEKPVENENRHEFTCSECGEHIVRLDATLTEAHNLCQKCKHDALLISGAIGALKKRFPGDLTFVVETKTRVITEKIAVVIKVETDEVVAEVKLCDDGIFSSERTAVAYNPRTQERFSKTVFGQKGFFSALRTTDTFDRDGNLIEHTRPGKGLPLAVGDDNKDAHVIQIAKNRFFLKKA